MNKKRKVLKEGGKIKDYLFLCSRIAILRLIDRLNILILKNKETEKEYLIRKLVDYFKENNSSKREISSYIQDLFEEKGKNIEVNLIGIDYDDAPVDLLPSDVKILILSFFEYCPSGKYQNGKIFFFLNFEEEGMSECKCCSEGFEPDFNRSSCVACEPGETSQSCGFCACCEKGFSPNVTHCNPCIDGYYSNVKR